MTAFEETNPVTHTENRRDFARANPAGEQTTLSIETALEVFLRGFTATRSFLRPYAARLIAPGVRLMMDLPPPRSDARVPEFVVYGAETCDALHAIAAQCVERHLLCVMLNQETPPAPVIDAYKAAGYRYVGREPLFAACTALLSDDPPPHPGRVRRVDDARTAQSVAKAARARQLLPEHIGTDNAMCRLYAAFDGELPIGWVRSVRTHPEYAWVSNLFVRRDYRRNGIGSELMQTLLHDDARLGVSWSVLLASAAGARLYPLLGYRPLGVLLLFSPVQPPQQATGPLPGGARPEKPEKE